MDKESLPQQRHLWGRRQSRPLKDSQRKALLDLWPQLSLELPEDTLLNPQDLFTPPKEDLWLEIGFGGGEHLAALAALNPHVGFLGCEPFINGVASLVMSVQEKSLTNIRLVKDDARLLLARLPAGCVGRVIILFPDPWPKSRHHKRRIIQKETVASFAKLLKPEGLLFIATDVAEYGQWIQGIMKESPAFEVDLKGRLTIYERPKDWPVTRYEQKGLQQGRAPVYLIYRKKK